MTDLLTGVTLPELRRRRSAKWTHYGADVLPAWVAEMDFPVATPVREALRRAVEADDLGYASPEAAGLGASFAGFAARRLGWVVDPAQVTPLNDVVAGIGELLMLLTEPGDAVIINPPVYPPFFTAITDLRRESAEVPLIADRSATDGALDLEGIERAFAGGARVLLLCNPHNPTGRMAGRGELERIAGIAAAHDGWVIADEIHAPLALGDRVHIPFTTVSRLAAERGIVLTSASKAFNIAGLKCAQAVTASPGPREVLARLPEAALHCGHHGVIASVAAYDDGDRWLDRVRALLETNASLLAEQLARRLPEVVYEPPAAGYLAWLDCRALGLGDDPAEAFLERGRVALGFGPRFGAQGAGFARLNIATSPELLGEIVSRMAVAAGR